MTYPLGKDPLEGKPCETCSDYATNCAVGCPREGDGHDSDCAANYLHADSVLTDEALAKINEVLKP